MTDDPVRELESAECWTELRTAVLGRLALCVGGEIDIFPINFVVDDDDVIYLRTAPGTKLLELSINDHVALEIDRVSDADAVSVVVKGPAERVELQSEMDAAEQLGLQPWIPTLKYRWVRIRPETVSGRAFVRGPEPTRE